jgi:protein subunit release factor A
MSIPSKDISFEYTKGKGPGGQHRNKTCSAVRAKHIPTGITAYVDGRDQHKNKRAAIKMLEKRVAQAKREVNAAKKKADRDHKIHNTETIRTYDYSRGEVKDHRTGKKASLKNILDKGKLDLLR